MTNLTENPDALPEASSRVRRLSWVWLIPVASLAIGGWLLWNTLARRGPLIDITFLTAEGLQEGQSRVRFKDIQVGTVESFDLTTDRSRVVMHVRMASKAEPLLTEGAQFWVVKPRLFAGDIIGLSTVVSGSYMEMSPGRDGEAARRDFIGLENPPALSAGMVGRLFRLTAARLSGLSVGSPVFFHEVEVGRVIDWKLTGMAESVTLTIFVNAPYDNWVHDDSRFWNTSGIALKVGADGVQLQVNSVKAAWLGGITFETPAGTTATRPSVDDHSFPLYANEEIAASLTAPQRFELATYLTGSVGGLGTGAPVTLLGLRVGEVTAVELQFNTDTNRPRVRVAFTVEANRATPIGDKPPPQFPEGFQKLVESGLRTSLKGSNLLTGQKQLALELDPEAPAAQAGMEGDVVVIPANGNGGGGIDELSAVANQLLAKIGKLPFDQIGRNLNASLEGVSNIVNGQQLSQALTRLNATLATAHDLVKHVDANAGPALRRLPGIATELQDTLAQVKALVSSVSAGSAGNTRFGRDLNLVLTQVADAALSVRMVADLLSRHPEALIRGRTGRAVE